MYNQKRGNPEGTRIGTAGFEKKGMK